MNKLSFEQLLSNMLSFCITSATVSPHIPNARFPAPASQKLGGTLLLSRFWTHLMNENRNHHHIMDGT